MSKLDTGTEGEKMGKREPLKVGDRVRVYHYPGTKVGTIDHIALGNRVSLKEFPEDWFHAKQCWRIPRKRAAPSVKRERLEVWLSADTCEKLLNSSEYEPIIAWAKEPHTNVNLVLKVSRFIQIKPGEVIIDREKLAMAYCEAFGCRDEDFVRTRGGFIEMAKALGMGGAR